VNIPINGSTQKVTGPDGVELLVDLLLLHRLAWLLVLLDGHDHRYPPGRYDESRRGVTSGQFPHEGHGNDVDRQHDVTTRRRSTIKVEAKAKLPLNWEPWLANAYSRPPTPSPRKRR
jgi:hypothetical protein